MVVGGAQGRTLNVRARPLRVALLVALRGVTKKFPLESELGPGRGGAKMVGSRTTAAGG